MDIPEPNVLGLILNVLFSLDCQLNSKAQPLNPSLTLFDHSCAIVSYFTSH